MRLRTCHLEFHSVIEGRQAVCAVVLFINAMVTETVEFVQQEREVERVNFLKAQYIAIQPTQLKCSIKYKTGSSYGGVPFQFGNTARMSSIQNILVTIYV